MPAWIPRQARGARLGGLLGLLLAVALVTAGVAGAVGATRPPTRSVSIERAREAIVRASPRGTSPHVGGCHRGREWTTCKVTETRTLTEEGGASYPVTLEFAQAVGERAHRLVLVTHAVRMTLPRSALTSR